MTWFISIPPLLQSCLWMSHSRQSEALRRCDTLSSRTLLQHVVRQEVHSPFQTHTPPQQVFGAYTSDALCSGSEAEVKGTLIECQICNWGLLFMVCARITCGKRIQEHRYNDMDFLSVLLMHFWVLGKLLARQTYFFVCGIFKKKYISLFIYLLISF